MIVFVMTLLVHFGCGAARNNSKPYQYTVPEETNDDWKTTPLSSENIDAGLVEELFNRVINHQYTNIHSVLVVKNGKLVIEEYFPGRAHALGRPLQDAQYREFNRATLHESHSVTKTVNSILMGIAVDRHLIRSVEEKISAFFPEYADLFADRAKGQLRLKHFLSMTGGLSWDEWTYPYTDARNDILRMLYSKDPFRFVLERPVVTRPGTRFLYHSGISLVLGEIIHKASGLRADKFAERYLFAPLGISDYSWETFSNGTVNTGGGLWLRPRDMAKVGPLYLNGGHWQGKQIVSGELVKESTKQQAPTHAYWFEWWPFTWGYSFLHKAPLIHFEYGYQWWLRSFPVRGRKIATYSAEGRGGQFIFLVPEFQMVAVFTGWNDNASWDLPLDMLQRYILPAGR
jgi:CubicO group peptidase (beta-lactamase class C family)